MSWVRRAGRSLTSAAFGPIIYIGKAATMTIRQSDSLGLALLLALLLR